MSGRGIVLAPEGLEATPGAGPTTPRGPHAARPPPPQTAGGSKGDAAPTPAGPGATGSGTGPLPSAGPAPKAAGLSLRALRCLAAPPPPPATAPSGAAPSGRAPPLTWRGRLRRAPHRPPPVPVRPRPRRQQQQRRRRRLPPETNWPSQSPPAVTSMRLALTQTRRRGNLKGATPGEPLLQRRAAPLAPLRGARPAGGARPGR